MQESLYSSDISHGNISGKLKPKKLSNVHTMNVRHTSPSSGRYSTTPVVDMHISLVYGD